MSQKKDDNKMNENSFEHEDRISNVMITPKNKDNPNKNKSPNDMEKELKLKNKYTSINYNSKSNINQEENRGLDDNKQINFSNAEVEFLNGMKSQMGISGSQNINAFDQQKLFETFLMFQKFISSQGNNNNKDNSDNLNQNIGTNNKENFDNFKNINEINTTKNNEIDKISNVVPPDYIHQRKKNKGTLSNSNLANEFKRSNSNNFSNLEFTNTKEKYNANTIEYDKIKLTLDENKFISDQNINDNYYQKNQDNKYLNESVKENKLNGNLINSDIPNNNINLKSGFNRLKNRNKSTSYDYDHEKEKKENLDNQVKNTIKENSNLCKTYNAENSKLNENKIKPINNTPIKDIEFSNRSSFDIKKENMPNNFENLSANKPEIDSDKTANVIKSNLNKQSDNKNENSSNNFNDNLIKYQDSNYSIKKFSDALESKNSNRNLKKKLKEEDFILKNDALLTLKNDINNKNINNLKIDNFDDIPIKASHTNFLELFEKNLAEEFNIYKTNKNDNTDDLNKEGKKTAIAKRANPRFKKEINVGVANKETKKYKYYSDNFENKQNDKADSNLEDINNEKEFQNERISFGNYKTEKPINKNLKNNSGTINGNNHNKLGINKSVERTNSKKLDSAKMQEDKSFNLNLNGNLSGSTHIPNSKGKFSNSNNRKASKNNPLR